MSLVDRVGAHVKNAGPQIDKIEKWNIELTQLNIEIHLKLLESKSTKACLNSKLSGWTQKQT